MSHLCFLMIRLSFNASGQMRKGLLCLLTAQSGETWPSSQLGMWAKLGMRYGHRGLPPEEQTVTTQPLGIGIRSRDMNQLGLLTCSAARVSVRVTCIEKQRVARLWIAEFPRWMRSSLGAFAFRAQRRRCPSDSFIPRKHPLAIGAWP